MPSLVPLEVLSDSSGSVTLGWVNRDVYCARFIGNLSAKLGRAHVTRLERAVTRAPSLKYFSDASGLASYDLLARSAFVRLVLEHRRRFSSLVMLTWAGGVTAATEAFAAAIGGTVHIIRDAAEFEKLLVRAAPLAQQLLDPLPLHETCPPSPLRR